MNLSRFHALNTVLAGQSVGIFKGGKLALMFELAGKEKREVRLRFELGLKPEQFAQAASDHDAEANG